MHSPPVLVHLKTLSVLHGTTKSVLISMLQYTEGCMSSVLGKKSTNRRFGQGRGNSLCKNSQPPWGNFSYVHCERKGKQSQSSSLGSPRQHSTAGLEREPELPVSTWVISRETRDRKMLLLAAKKPRGNSQVVSEHFITCLSVWLSLVLFKRGICIQDMKWI